MTEQKLHNLDTILTPEEIEELRSLCYKHTNSWCPIGDFFNDIFYYEPDARIEYNKNQRYKDLWLILLFIIKYSKQARALEIISDKINKLYDLVVIQRKMLLSQEQIKVISYFYDLLKEVML